jgi:hypothetical protein
MSLKYNHLKSILLHILPGLLAGMAYYLFVPFVKENGFPSVMALIIAGVFVLLPFELGTLFYYKKKSGKPFFDGVIVYSKQMPKCQYLLWISVILVSSGFIFTVLNNFSEYIKTFFSWIPNDYILDSGLSDNYTKANLLITYLLFFVFIVIVIPVVEELYFRGFLLPRMRLRTNGLTAIIHSALFAVYHTWTPWLIVTRTLAVFPLIYIVKRKENIWVGIISHCLLNLIDFIVGIIFICKM